MSWQNVKINENGNPEDLIIVVDGSLSITGGQTVINAIIYVKGSLTVNGSASITGALTSVGSGSGFANYNANYINNADFDGMCESSATYSCDADSAFPVIFDDDFSSTKPWATVDFDTSIRNWPNDNRFPYNSNEAHSVAFNVSSNLDIAGNAQGGGHNEYGMIGYNLSAESIDSSAAESYSIYSEIYADNVGLNNDLGMVFGFVDDRNYYLARWGKYGTSYSSDNSFPGVYRRLELIKMANGTPTRLDSVNNIDLGNNLSMKVIVKAEGIGVCTGDSDGNTFSEDHHFTYTRNDLAKITPFNANFEVPIDSIIDSDFVSTQYGGNDYKQNPVFINSNSVEIRFGRWVIENAYGPETEKLPVNMRIEQWNGSAFEINADESCLTPKYGVKDTSGSFYDGLAAWQYRLLDLDNSVESEQSITPDDTNVLIPGVLFPFERGEYKEEFIFAMPRDSNSDGFNERGSLKFEYEVPSWLKYDWKDQDGTFDDNPTSTISFGLFRGNDRIISWREVEN